MSYVIDTVENDGKYVRTYDGRNGKMYVYNVATTEGAAAQVSKLKGKPQKGDVYKTLKMPPDNAPDGALPTLMDKDYDASPPPDQTASNDSPSSGDDKQSSITRQGAEQRAALYLIAKAMVKQHLDEDLTREDFKKLVDWFVEDAHA